MRTLQAPQFFSALQVCQLRKLTSRELQEISHFVINISAAWRGGRFFASQQL
jgi:hypothetical protein